MLLANDMLLTISSPQYPHCGKNEMVHAGVP
jgi:hypothetical protein